MHNIFILIGMVELFQLFLLVLNQNMNMISNDFQSRSNSSLVDVTGLIKKKKKIDKLFK